MAETDDSVVGRGLRAPPGPNTGGTGDSPVIPPNKSRASLPCVLGEDPAHHSLGDGGFDAEKLHAQLSGLLQLYLARASDPGAVKQCSAKDAIACAKTLTAMMTDVQSGKLNSRSGDFQTPTPSIPSRRVRSRAAPLVGAIHELPADKAPNRVRGADQRRSGNGDCENDTKSRAGEPGLLNEESSRYSLFTRRSPGEGGHATGYSPLHDALAAVLSTDQESHLPEPYQRVLSRMDRLCEEVQTRLYNNRSGGLQTATPLISRPGGRESVPINGGTGDSPVIASSKSRAGEPGPPVEDSSILSNTCPPSRVSRDRRDQHLPAKASAKAGPTTNNGALLKARKRKRSLYTQGCGNGRGAARAPT